MKIGLVGPTDCGVLGNPGWHLITEGIRYLIMQVEPRVSFIPINMQAPDASWSAAATCDRIIICGNPRFTLSTGNEFWENDMWDLLVGLQRDGRRVIDGWAGSAFPYNEYQPTVEEMATAIMAFPGRAKRLEQARQLHGRITRDETMQLIYGKVGIESILLPCSSWWACFNFDYISPDQKRVHDLLIVYRMPGHDWLGATLQRIVSDMHMDFTKDVESLPVRIITTTWPDYLWAHDAGFNTAELVADPWSLLQLYATSRRVLSFRLHAAIPAASLGCEVAAVAIDSRTDTCKLFNIPVVRFTDLNAWSPTFARASTPDYDLAHRTLHTLLC